MAQIVETKSIETLKQFCRIIPYLPVKKLTVDYDEEADVLYLKFEQPANIYQSKLTDDDILMEYDESGRLTGVTILEASQRLP